MKTEKFHIENLKCGGCVNSVKKAVIDFKEVKKVDVSLEDGMVTVDFEGNEQILDQIKKKLSSIGYPQADGNNMFKKAQSYVSCAIGRMDSDTTFDFEK